MGAWRSAKITSDQWKKITVCLIFCGAFGSRDQKNPASAALVLNTGKKKLMSSEFDELIQQLKLVQTSPEALRKALPASTGSAPLAFSLKALGRNLDLMAKSLRMPKPVQSQRRKPSEREMLLKSLVSLGLGIREADTSGSMSRVQTVEIQARFNALVAQALPRLTARR